MRTRTLVAVVACLAAGCATGDATEPSSLVVDVENTRSAQTRGVLYARLANEGDEPLEVTGLQLVDPRFAAVPATPKSTTVEAGGGPVLTPFDYGEVVCEAGATGPATLAVTVVAGSETEERIVPVATAGEEALTRLHESACRQRAATEAASIRFGPDWESTSPAVARGRIVLERAASDQAVAEVEVEVSAARCDPHALIESKKTYSFPIWVRVGQAPAAYVVLEPEGDARTAMEQLVEVGCDLDH